ncbi:hypothetical protein M0208_16395 [Sphingomonas sp. SUN019]|uniref:hypothetical protein n=1 Tax=Sphingomonas sp. SUN019 TaxID=2937788 RepID=UPI0021646046|nr:hypothetical protein [Sphingomonas sp. SUN019]UVO52013.1 hypothetical protein M0208_16395 [Sphingomonas sp. SUN019]
MKPQLHGDASAGVRGLVESKVGEVLTGQPDLTKGAAADTAQIAAVVAAAVIALPLAQQKRLKAKIADVVDMIAALACNDDLAERV